MESSRIAFERLLYDRLIPEFCSDPKRRCEPSTFDRASVRVRESDAADFLRAWNAGLFEHRGRGLYRSATSTVSEQFFWTGRNLPGARSFKLWLEPVITVAAFARLHFDYGWPHHLISTQSVDWAFDLVARLPDREHEFVAGEIKKTEAEIDQLLVLMKEFGRNPNLPVPASGKARNAYKKVLALRRRQAPVFWAIGPGGFSKVHAVEYGADGAIDLAEGPHALRFESHQVAPS